MSSKKCCICCCVSLVVIFLIALAVLFVVPQKVGASIEASYKVTDASLSQFSVGRGNNLAYNLVANMTVQNPNKYATYTYDKFEATASYNDEDLSEVKVPTFNVEKKESTALPSIVFKGEKSLKDVSKIKGGSVYDIVLKIKVKLMSKAGKVDVYNEYKIKCNLKVPLVDPKGKSTAKFEATDCKKDGGTTSGIKM